VRVEGVKCDACSAKDASEDSLLPMEWVHLDIDERNTGGIKVDLCPKRRLMTLGQIMGLAAELKKKHYG
jgi:hypothetical protein